LLCPEQRAKCSGRILHMNRSSVFNVMRQNSSVNGLAFRRWAIAP
jgi:hypothetical protein